MYENYEFLLNFAAINQISENKIIIQNFETDLSEENSN